MTLPNGPAGITQGPLQAATSVYGADGGLPRAATLDQSTAEDLLKQMFVLDNDAINDPLAAIFSGLRMGISLPLAILEAVAKKVLGLAEEVVFFSVDHVLTALRQLPQRLVDLAQEVAERFQLLLNTIFNAITGGTGILTRLEDLAQALHLIPGDNVQVGAGGGSLLDMFFNVLNAIVGGGVGQPGSTGATIADVMNVMSQLGSGSALGKYAFEIANRLNNTPVARGFLPTGRANYDWTSTNTFLPTTQANALSVSFGLLQAMPLGVFSWCGYGTAGITAFYFNVRKVNLLTGVRSLVHHSGNIVGNLQPGTTPDDAAFMFYEVPAVAVLPGEPTDYYYGELVPVGGTHYVRGMSFSDNIPDHPTAAVPCVATVVNYSSNPNSPAIDLPKATSSPDVAWLEFAVSMDNVGDHHEPTIWTFDNDGESIPTPAWANRVDRVLLSGGGTGHAGLTAGFAGEPGWPGKFFADTLLRGTDFTGDVVHTFNALTDGTAKMSIPGNEISVAPGADGGGARLGLIPVGHGPGVFDYNGQKYVGGVDQRALGGAGQDPGGGGNGGGGLLGFLQAGGKGGKPAGWLCFRQVEVPDEVPTGDTTPPTPPTSITVEATYSSLIIDWTGAEDA